MSTGATSNLIYRLSEVDGGTLISFKHSMVGPVPDEFQQHMASGLGGDARTRQARRPKRHEGIRRSIMKMIDVLLAELEQEAQATRARARARAAGTAVVEAACRSRCRSASWRCTSRPFRATSRSWPRQDDDSRAAAVRPGRGGDGRGARARARRPASRRRARSLGGFDDAAMMETWRLHERRQGPDGHAARRRGARHHAEPLVSPSRPADGLPADAQRPAALRLRTTADENPFAAEMSGAAR